MSNAIIGGAIAAAVGIVSGVITGMWLERRREKAQRLIIVEALITEIQENLTICETDLGRKMWWVVRYRLEAYRAYKGQLCFLPEAVRVSVMTAAITMEAMNSVGIDVQLKEGSGQRINKKHLPPLELLIDQLKFAHKELVRWRAQHN